MQVRFASSVQVNARPLLVVDLARELVRECGRVCGCGCRAMCNSTSCFNIEFLVMCFLPFGRESSSTIGLRRLLESSCGWSVQLGAVIAVSAALERYATEEVASSDSSWVLDVE